MVNLFLSVNTSFTIGGDIVKTDDWGTFSSPNFPSNYDNALDESFTIYVGDRPVDVMIMFKSFSMEPDTNCGWDFLKVNEQIFCGGGPSDGVITSTYAITTPCIPVSIGSTLYC